MYSGNTLSVSWYVSEARSSIFENPVTHSITDGNRYTTNLTFSDLSVSGGVYFCAFIDSVTGTLFVPPPFRLEIACEVLISMMHD